MMEKKIPVQCPVCSTIFFVKPEDLKDKICCPKCNTPLELRAFPTIKSIHDAYLLSMINTYQNINKLYEALIKLIEKMLGGR